MANVVACVSSRCFFLNLIFDNAEIYVVRDLIALCKSFVRYFFHSCWLILFMVGIWNFINFARMNKRSFAFQYQKRILRSSCCKSDDHLLSRNLRKWENQWRNMSFRSSCLRWWHISPLRWKTGPLCSKLPSHKHKPLKQEQSETDLHRRVSLPVATFIVGLFRVQSSLIQSSSDSIFSLYPEYSCRRGSNAQKNHFGDRSRIIWNTIYDRRDSQSCWCSRTI